MIIPDGFPRLPKSFEYETRVAQSSDGEHSIFLSIYRKKNVPVRKALLVLHGQGEHGGRYQHFPHYLENTYDLMVMPDLRGHGRSEGIRGHVESFDEYVDDALLAWDELQKSAGAGCELDWFAHSMGGTVTLRALQGVRSLGIRNLILSSPCVGLTVEVPVAKEIAARVLSRFWGHLQMGTGLNPEVMSHDPAVAAAIRKDSLHHTKATPKFYLGFVEAMEVLREGLVRIPQETRVLFQLAGDDRVVSTEASSKLFDRLEHPEKKKIIYPGLFHEIFNEESKEAVFKDWIGWLK